MILLTPLYFRADITYGYPQQLPASIKPIVELNRSNKPSCPSASTGPVSRLPFASWPFQVRNTR
jgi:hypothetical protein